MARDDWLFVDRAPEYRRAAREPPTNRIHAAPTTRVPTAVVGRVAPGGQLPLTWPRHTGPPRAPTRGSRGGLALPSPDTRERRGVGNSNWSPPTARALILLDAITFSLSLSLSLCLFLPRADREEEHFRAGHGDFGSDGPTHGPVWIFFLESMTRSTG